MFPKRSSERSGGSASLVFVRSPRSAAAEAYRVLRTNLLFSSVDQPIRTVLITSAGPADGKTTAAANLGAALVEGGKQVLLVDCDLRRPGLHNVFGLPLAPGLTNALIDDVEEPALSPTAVPGLLVLPAGDAPPNPAEFIASTRLARLIERLRDKVDVVLIDSPPVSVAADAAVLAAAVDGVILVLSAGHTKRDVAQRAKEQLDSVGARVLGAVLNNAKLDKSVREYHSQ